MSRIKVKVFSADSSKGLEKQINEFIATLDEHAVGSDINTWLKFSTSMSENNETYAAVMSYKVQPTGGLKRDYKL